MQQKIGSILFFVRCRMRQLHPTSVRVNRPLTWKSSIFDETLSFCYFRFLWVSQTPGAATQWMGREKGSSFDSFLCRSVYFPITVSFPIQIRMTIANCPYWMDNNGCWTVKYYTIKNNCKSSMHTYIPTKRSFEVVKRLLWTIYIFSSIECFQKCNWKTNFKRSKEKSHSFFLWMKIFFCVADTFVYKVIAQTVQIKSIIPTQQNCYVIPKNLTPWLDSNLGLIFLWKMLCPLCHKSYFLFKSCRPGLWRCQRWFANLFMNDSKLNKNGEDHQCT
jgi:hypothetical protein